MRKWKKRGLALLMSVLLGVSLLSAPAKAAQNVEADSLLDPNREEYSLAESFITTYENGRMGASDYFSQALPASDHVDGTMADFVASADQTDPEKQTDPNDQTDPEKQTDPNDQTDPKESTDPTGPDETEKKYPTVNGISVEVINIADYAESKDNLGSVDRTGKTDVSYTLSQIMQLSTNRRYADQDTERWTLLYFPAGTYLFEDIFWIPSHTWIYLEEGAVFQRGNPEIPLAKSVALGERGDFDNSLTIGWHDCFSGIVLEGGTWDGGNDQKTDGEAYANLVILTHGQNVVVRNAVFQYCIEHMLNLSGDANVLVENCRFAHMPEYTGNSRKYYGNAQTEEEKAAIRMYTEAIHLDYVNEEGEPGNLYDGAPCENCTVRNCSFTDCQRGVGTHHVISTNQGDPAYAPSRANQFTFENNSFSGMRSEPYSLFSFDNVVIADSSSDGHRFFEEGIDCHSVLVLNNTVSNAKDKDIIFSDSDKIVVSGLVQTSTNTTQPAMYFVNVKKSVIENCCIVKSGGTGISLWSSENIYVNKNTVGHTALSMIFLRDSRYVTVRENQLSDGGHYGIQCIGGSDNLILGNVLQNLGYNGICIQGSAAEVTQTDIYYNSVTNSVGRGISMEYASGKIRGNIIDTVTDEADGTKSNGMMIIGSGTRSERVSVENNYIRTCTNTGVRARNLVNAAIRDNRVSGTKGTGMHITDCSYSEIRNNVVVNDSGAWTAIQIQGLEACQITDNQAVGGKNAVIQTGGEKNVVIPGNTVTSWYFSDIKQSGWKYPGVLFCKTFGNIIAGGTNGKLNPAGENVSRRDFALILYNMMGSPDVKGDYPFADAAGYAKTAVTWASQAGVVSGYTDGTFGVKNNLKRYELALMLYRMVSRLGLDTSARGDLTVFTDVTKDFLTLDKYAAQREALSWAIGTGIIAGTNGKLDRSGTATRVQCAAMISRLVTAYPELAGYFLEFETQ